MIHLRNLLILGLISVLLMSCAHVSNPPQPSGDLTQLADWMTGFFSSLQQSQDDPQYWDIHLHMALIWPGRTDGYWIYVEQAMAGQDPYRQRVYHVTEPVPGRFASKVYELENPDAFIGAWDNTGIFNSLSPEDLIDRTGCTIFLVRNPDGTFRGSTHERDCLSELRGAAYAVSQVRLTADQLMSWDRGYDAEGNQVWGAIKGGYVFDKLENYDL